VGFSLWWLEIVLFFSSILYTVMLFFRWKDIQRKRDIQKVVQIMQDHENIGDCIDCKYYLTCKKVVKSLEENGDL
jgi:hypothetical protein